MKLSLNWIFDHIIGDKSKISVTDLVDRFIKTTAEIDNVEKVILPVERLTLGQITTIDEDKISVYSLELQRTFLLPSRSDAFVGSWYVIEHNDNSGAWAKINSIGGIKDTLLPVVDVDQSLQAGGWKNKVELSDYILDIDNKSINHRPDLWGHRGIAREIAAIFDMSLVPLQQLIADKKVREDNNKNLQGYAGNFVVTIENPNVCKQFAALSIDTIQSRPSSLEMVIRLSRLDARSINYIVDCTNYVMLDFGHPMHAFDAATLSNKSVMVRQGKKGEKITILDADTIELTPQDIVIADGSAPISLAGIMGGLSTGVTNTTTSLFIEAAHFDATTIRRTAARCKKRTEASMRFAKSLDPYCVVDVIKRYLFMLDKAGVKYNGDNCILRLGSTFVASSISVAHDHIEKMLGIELKPERVVSILEKLFFIVTHTMRNDELWYEVTPPSFRMTKDISIAQDIIEEIGRYVGYDSIARVMPALHKEPSDLSVTYRLRAIKSLLSTGLSMREFYGYSFFDEQFLKTLNWNPSDYVAVKNPISENYTRLVTTLQPHLLKTISENSIHHKQLRFYEWARVWAVRNGVMSEKKSLSGIFFEQESTFDFYDGKALLCQLFDSLDMTVEWKKVDTSVFPWLSVHQTALLVHNEAIIGIAGMIEAITAQQLSVAQGAGFIFEIDGDYIQEYKQKSVHFEPLPKYPLVRRDVSMLTALSDTIDVLSRIIKETDARIVSVSLVDFFTKDEWKDKKAVTFHVTIRDNDKTLDHQEVETLWNKVITRLQEHGATIR